MGILNSIFKGFHQVINGGKDVLAPVEGISFEDWAKANAGIASGKSVDETAKLLGVDRPRWDRANEEWLSRMKNDKTFTLSMKYASIFNNNAAGNLPQKKDFNDQTYPIEKYAEVMVAMDYLGRQGRDAQDVLKDFGLTVADYSNLSSYYTKKIFMSPMGLGMKFQNLMMEYRAKYEKIIQDDGTHDDIKF
ncbi:MAG: hypothetical protein J0M37_03345 [Ignavibacteria bacterium]|nr:hypothetical protein [Ignavibacteria bacterium]